MNRFKFLFLAIFAISLSIVSCKKDEKTKTELLTNKGWVLKAMTVDPAIVNPVTQTSFSDVYAQLEACTKDDITTFKDNNTAILDEGAAKCSNTDPQTTTVNWSFNSTETIITVDGEDWQIVELSESKLVCKYSETFLGTTYTYTVTFQ